MAEHVEDVLRDIIGRLTILEERIGVTESTHGEVDDIITVDNVNQISDPHPNQIILVKNDPAATQPGGRLLIYDANIGQWQAIT